MTANGATNSWAQPVIDFILGELPRDPDRSGWTDMALSAYELGCLALVALGQAKLETWGASPRAAPKLPVVLPRWDDICSVVLGLADQHNQIDYFPKVIQKRQANPAQFVIKPIGGPAPPEPNIAASHGLGAARASAKATVVLTALGLLENGQWTKQAEAILWRENPREWNLDIVGHPMFKRVVERTIETMPPDIQAELDKLTSIEDAEVDAAMESRRKAQENPRPPMDGLTLFSPDLPPLTRERVVSGIQFDRAYQMDRLFFRRWRFADCWLSPTDAKRALGIFHDPLAKAMRRAVMGKLYPGTAFAE